MIFSANGLEILKCTQGFRCKPCANVVGYGHQIVPGDGVVPNGDIITSSKAMELLKKDVFPVVGEVNNHVTSTITQNQFDAIVILAYNLGISVATVVLRTIKAGDLIGAAEQFLILNRLVEHELFTTPDAPIDP